MTRRLRHADMVRKDEDVHRTTAQRQAAIRAAHILAEAMEDSCRGGDPQFNGNMADALYHIACALQRIADVVESKWAPKP
jgi:hypothetical protein